MKGTYKTLAVACVIAASQGGCAAVPLAVTGGMMASAVTRSTLEYPIDRRMTKQAQKTLRDCAAEVNKQQDDVEVVVVDKKPGVMKQTFSGVKNLGAYLSAKNSIVSTMMNQCIQREQYSQLR